MQKHLLILITLCVTMSLWASNEITYTAISMVNVSSKAFNVPVSQHTFADGQGKITFSNNVTSIEDNAFESCISLSSITLPYGVVNIGNSAFKNCYKLTTIIIPQGVKQIGDNAFKNCSSLAAITIPNSITIIGDGLLDGCSSLKSITIPNGVTSIGDRAFNGCSKLISITIPNSVIHVGNNAFTNCSSLTSVSISNRLTVIEKAVFSNCTKLTSVVIPEGVISIGDNAFSNCTFLDSILIPDRVTNIGLKAFYGCGSLKSITIPKNVSSIGTEAFSGCRMLSAIDVDDSNMHFVSVDGVLFNHNRDVLIQCPTAGARTEYTVPDGVTSIGIGAFSNCSSIKSITVPNSVTSIGTGAFKKCTSLTTFTIPDKVTKIMDNTFADCSSLAAVTFSNEVSIIGNYSFADCASLKSITIPSSVTNIKRYAFQHCPLTEVRVPSASLKQFSKMNGLHKFKKMIVGYTGTYTAQSDATQPTVSVGTQELTYVQSISITQPFDVVNMSSVLTAYHNEFAKYDMPDRDDSFPYALFRVRLVGNRNLVKAAKQTLQLNLGQMMQIEEMVITYDNQILFLVPRNARIVYITCGDGCEQQLIYSGRLQSDRIYEGIVEVK